MQNQKIKTVTEFLIFLESLESKNLIYRGENKRYDIPLLATAFRNKNDYTRTHEEMQKLFYNATINSISDAQKENFMAFSPDHGIPTCMLDFTRNPLVSLYFACSKNPDDDGYIYILEDNTIDITDFLGNINDPPLLNRLAANPDKLKDLFYRININPANVVMLLQRLCSYIKNSKAQQNPAIISYLEDMIHYYQNRTDPKNKPRPEANETAPDDSVYKKWAEIIEIVKQTPGAPVDDIDKIQSSFHTGDGSNKNTILSVVFVIIYFSLHLHQNALSSALTEKKGIDNEFVFFEQPFIISCSPPNIAERVNNQSSIFIYQNYKRDIWTEFEPEKYNYIDAVQKIEADHVVEIPREYKKNAEIAGYLWDQ